MMSEPHALAGSDRPRGGLSLKFLLGFVMCALALAGVLALVHGPGHLSTNPVAVTLVLGGVAFCLCSLALIFSSALKLATGRSIARSWWLSLMAVTLLAVIGLYLLEVTAL